MVRKQALDLAVEHLQIGEIHQPNGAPSDLVLVSGADAAAGGADRSLAGRALACDVELLVQRQDQRRVFRNPQIVRCHHNALLFELVDFAQQRVRVEHHAVTDYRKFSRPYHARRQ